MQKSIHKTGLYFSLAAALSLFAFNNAALADDDESTISTVKQVEVDNDDNDVEVDDTDTDTDTDWDYGDTDTDD